MMDMLQLSGCLVKTLRAPGSLLDPHEAEMLEVQEAATDPQSAMFRSLQMREAAKISIIKQDNDGRLRRARLHKVVPMPPMYETGAYVYFKRKKDKSVALKPGEDVPRHQQSKNQMYQWFGIARVNGL